jgi:histidinol-phosphate aminotransferase
MTTRGTFTMHSSTRPAVDIPAYVPGSSDPQLVKMSSNESPFDPLPGVLERAVAAARSMHRYPDLHATEVRSAIAVRTGHPIEGVVVGPGSAGVLQQLLGAVAGPGDEVVHPWRSFEAYPILTRQAAATAITVPLTPDGRMDLPAMVEAVTPRTRAVLVCTPNNPTGRAVRRSDLEEFLSRIPEAVTVVLDEAYVEYVTDTSAVDGLDVLPGRHNLCLLRTFSKAYGLAALRIGYALAAPELAEAARRRAVPFSVSAIAQQAALESLRREAECRSRVGETVRERERVRAALLDQRWDVPDSQANFVWLPTGEATGDFAEFCRQAGFLVRPFDGEGCRVTISRPEDNDLFLQTAGAWRRSSRSDA